MLVCRSWSDTHMSTLSEYHVHDSGCFNCYKLKAPFAVRHWLKGNGKCVDERFLLQQSSDTPFTFCNICLHILQWSEIHMRDWNGEKAATYVLTCAHIARLHRPACGCVWGSGLPRSVTGYRSHRQLPSAWLLSSRRFTYTCDRPWTAVLCSLFPETYLQARTFLHSTPPYICQNASAGRPCLCHCCQNSSAAMGYLKQQSC